MSGFCVLLRKELLEAWRTRRLPVVALLFLVVGIVSPLTARYLNEILKAALGDQLPRHPPARRPPMALEQLQKNLGQLGALAAIALAMGSRLRRARPRDGGPRPRPAGDEAGVPAGEAGGARAWSSRHAPPWRLSWRGSTRRSCSSRCPSAAGW